MTNRFGWRRDSLDPRDHLLARAPAPADAPNYIDLRHQFEPPVYDQAARGSCVGNALNGNIQYVGKRQKLPWADLIPSRLMTYYGARAIEGSVASDSGCEIRDAIKFVAKNGFCFESGPDAWPYDIDKFTQKPPAKCYAMAAKHRITSYARVPQTVDGIRTSLFQGYPIVFGFTVYQALEDPEITRTGRLPMPVGDPIGGHAVVIIGCDLDNRTVLIRNSWGEKWTPNYRGHFMMPLEYVLNPELASDFWQVSAVSG